MVRPPPVGASSPPENSPPSGRWPPGGGRSPRGGALLRALPGGRIRGGPAPTPPPQVVEEGADPGLELPELEGLGQRAEHGRHGAELAGELLVEVAGDHQGGREQPLLAEPGQLGAGALPRTELDVREHQVGANPPEQGARLGEGDGAPHAVAAAAEEPREEVGDPLVVLHDQDVGGGPPRGVGFSRGAHAGARIPSPRGEGRANRGNRPAAGLAVGLLEETAKAPA